MKTQAWGWLAAGVLAAGLNASYHDGGMQWAHRIADRIEHGSAAVLALASGHAERFLAEAQYIVAKNEKAPCPLSTALAKMQSSLAHVQTKLARSENEMAHLDDMTARANVLAAQHQAERDRWQARWEANRDRIEARVAAGRARVWVRSTNWTPVMVETRDCPQLRVEVPRIPRIRVPRTPTVRIPTVQIPEISIPEIPQVNVQVPAIRVDAGDNGSV